MDYYGIDFGGTNLRISRVNPATGDLVGDLISYPMKEFTQNEELTELVMSYIPRNSHVGISAAGPVDEANLIIKFAANSPIKTEITFGRDLRDRAGCYVTQTNDMNAAVQAAARYGHGKGHENVLLATYSSGFNCAMSRGGLNLTSAEFGHTIYKPGGDLYCGCGAKGHLESYVSGNGAALMAKQYFSIRQLKRHPILDFSLSDCNNRNGTNHKPEALEDPHLYAMVLNSITAKHVYTACARMPEDEPQKDIRETQIEAIADSFGKMNAAYHPVDVLVLMGSQTKDWEILFTPAIERYMHDRRKYQLECLPKPTIIRTAITEIGITGAVAYLLCREDIGKIQGH